MAELLIAVFGETSNHPILPWDSEGFKFWSVLWVAAVHGLGFGMYGFLFLMWL